MRLIIADPGLQANLGHHGNACRHIVQAARSRGVPVRVLAHVDVNQDVAAALGAEPFFRAYTYVFSDGDPHSGWRNAFQRTVDATVQDLARLSDVRPDDVFFFHGAQPAQLMAAVEWAASLTDDRCPLVLVELATEPGVDIEVKRTRVTFDLPNPYVDPRPVLYRIVSQEMEKVRTKPLAALTYDREVSKIYSQLMDRPIGVLPFPTPPDTSRRNRAQNRPITISVLGHQQLRKGYHFTPDLIKRLLAECADIRFLAHNSDALQLKSAGRELMRLTQEALRQIASSDARVVLEEGAVSFDKWVELLEATDLLLCPYDPKRYAHGHSGLASMAIANAIPLVVPAKTPLARWLRDFGGPGVTFPAFDIDAIYAATKRALDEFDLMAERAHAAASRWSAVHGPDKFLDAVIRLAGARSKDGASLDPKVLPSVRGARVHFRQSAERTSAGPISLKLPTQHVTAGIALAAKGEVAQALQEFEAALAQWPTYAEAFFYRGMALEPLDRIADAYDSYVQAIMLVPDYADAEARLSALAPKLARPAAILTPWIKDPAPFIVRRAWRRLRRWVGARDEFQQRHQDGAEVEARAELMQMPQSAKHASRLGRILAAQGRVQEAELFFRYALKLAPWSGEAAIGLCQELDKQPPKLPFIREVATAARRAGSTDERLPATALWADLTIGRWDSYQKRHKEVLKNLKRKPSSVTPFTLLHLTNDAALHKKCASAFYQILAGDVVAEPGRQGPDEVERRLNIGYLSADFRNHAVAQLCAELFELHDRRRVKVIGLSTLASDESDMAQRVRGSCDALIDLTNINSETAAARIVAGKVDILVDLTGYTFNARPRILAARPAPILVNYLGYPGTLATSAVDYVIVDKIVAPPDHQRHFCEALVHMPGAYQVNDRKRTRGTKTFTRAELGLPDDGTVFCCFNEMRKILPETFRVWMRVLIRVPGSVLWLLTPHAVAIENIRQEASRCGVDPSRIIFAGRMNHDAHMSRYRMADLFLDTQPYNAHTTASDAIWVGCPVLTLIGETFSGRVAASLLTAAGVPELVTRTWQDYEDLAVRLGNDAVSLARLRKRVESGGANSVLFDSPRFARQLEWAYREMWRRCLQAERPRAFEVPENVS